MIQRIQSIYLFLVICACVAFIFVPFGYNTMNTNDSRLVIKNILPLMIASIVIACIALISIFLYTNRKLQLNIVKLNIVLSLALIGLFIFGITQHIGLQNYTFGVGAILPIFILLFNILAFSGIKFDDKLVKSMDRLR